MVLTPCEKYLNKICRTRMDVGRQAEQSVIVVGLQFVIQELGNLWSNGST